MFEILEHTADIGFRARGNSLEALFASAAEALMSIILDVDEIAERESCTLCAEGEDLEALLVNWLSEVLYWQDGRQLAMRRFQIDELSAGRVRATAFGEPIDPNRHHGRLMVKAITYHQLRVAQVGTDWEAEVYLDV